MSTKQGLKIAIQETIKQGCRSVNEDGDCLYRGQNKTKCAIGHLIPDSKCTPDIENLGVIRVLNLGIIPKQYLTDSEYQTYFKGLQICHDDSDDDNFVESFCGKINRNVQLEMLPKYCLDFLPDEFRE